MQALKEIHAILKSRLEEGRRIPYAIPNLWVEEDLRRPPSTLRVNPYEFFCGRIESILNSTPLPGLEGEGGTWSRRAAVYNLLVRLTSAFDHNQNGALESEGNEQGFRETGTFLKTLALLPYIRRLGANTLHLLPVTAIGRDGRKGNLGSPYAIRNPIQLDPSLAEPFLGLGAEKEFQALVEAAHHLGMRVIVEFVFRTMAKDGDWVAEHPDWFYWIKDSVPDRPQGGRDAALYGSPIFSPGDLARIREKVDRGDFQDLPAPPPEHRAMFALPPAPGGVKLEEGRWIGASPDGARCRIPGAFADWPPDDIQPPWNDVTYLRMYRRDEFNYIAYNTIRMYDARLAREENRNEELWEAISGILPSYIRTFGIDGAMVDMGHALPLPLLKRMVEKARALRSDFAFWAEDFSPGEESRRQGYNAAIGYIWSDQHIPDKMRNLLRRYAKERFPLTFFGTPESHNSPRAAAREGGARYSRFSWGINSFLPVIPFIHSGFELGERRPVNTGLCFTEEELKKFPAERLPLFSQAALDWGNADHLSGWMQKISAIRQRFESLVLDDDPATLRALENCGADACGFAREKAGERIYVLGNLNLREEARAEVEWPEDRPSLRELISGEVVPLRDRRAALTLRPGGIAVLG